MLAKFTKHNISIRFRDRMTLQSTVIGHPVPKFSQNGTASYSSHKEHVHEA